MNCKSVAVVIGLLITGLHPGFAQSKKVPATNDRTKTYTTRTTLIPYTVGNTKFGFIDSISHAIIIPASYDQVHKFINGMSVVKLHNKYGFVSAAGKVITPKYDCVTLFSEGYSAVVNGVVETAADGTITKITGLWGFIDMWGNEVIPLKYEVALPFKDGLANVNQGGKVGFIDKAGNTVIPFMYEDGASFKDRKARVKLNGEWIYINLRGEKVSETAPSAQLPKYYIDICNSIKEGGIEDVEAFVKKGVDLNIKYSGEYPYKAVFNSRSLNKTGILKLLINNGQDINAVDEYGYPLILNVLTEGSGRVDKYELLKLLIEKKANVNATDKYKNTALHVLCRKNEGDNDQLMVQLLIDNGADPALQNDDGLTPLKMAKKNDRDALVELLKKAMK
jgi:hypothetical protein